MTQYLPPNLLELFRPRPPLVYLKPEPKKSSPRYGLLSQHIHKFELQHQTPVRVKLQSKKERYETKKREKHELAAYKVEQGIALWDPNKNPDATTDPYKTLFVARLNYDTTEAKIRRVFEAYGPILKIHMIKDRVAGKPRGYCFIEFKKEKHMHDAYKRADGVKIDGKRVLVDVERGRTQKGWLPRRLAGGLGGRKTEKTEKTDD